MFYLPITPPGHNTIVENTIGWRYPTMILREYTILYSYQIML